MNEKRTGTSLHRPFHFKPANRRATIAQRTDTTRPKALSPQPQMKVLAGCLAIVRAIVLNGLGQVLLLRRAASQSAPGCYTCPGGKVEQSERVQDALWREVREETHLQARAWPHQFLFTLQDPPRAAGRPGYMDYYWVIACTSGPRIQLNEESSGYAWVGPDDYTDYPLAFTTDRALRLYWSKDNLQLDLPARGRFEAQRRDPVRARVRG